MCTSVCLHPHAFGNLDIYKLFSLLFSLFLSLQVSSERLPFLTCGCGCLKHPDTSAFYLQSNVYTPTLAESKGALMAHLLLKL